MELEEYQLKATRTMNKELTFKDSVLNMCIGLSGEVGEINDIIKKHYFQGHNLDRSHLIEEIGDVFFYLVNLCSLYGIEADKCIENNHYKLLLRYPDGFEVEKSINRGVEDGN